MRIDLGDLHVDITATVKGLQPPHLTWRIGPVADSVPADRTPGPRPLYKTPPGKVDWIMDLKADQKVTFGLTATDEMGNPATFAGSITYAVDDESVAALTDNGDGTGEVAAVGPLGQTLLTGTAVRDADGRTFTGTALINVVAGDAETFEITFGTPEEVTPDE